MMCYAWLREKSAMDKTSLLYWWPKIKDLEIPVPRTEIQKLPDGYRCEFWKVLDGKAKWPPVWFSDTIELVSQIGYPLFMRTDLYSAKHSWGDICFVEESDKLLSHIWRLLEASEMVSLGYEALVLREYILLESAFTAFAGDLPIAKERRYFVRDGDVICHHPYWPADAIEQSYFLPEESDWKELLVQLNQEDEVEIALLSDYACGVSEKLEGYWSVDFAKGQDGIWYLIDMAEGEKSWHPPCESAL
jgi:hypothetical protein